MEYGIWGLHAADGLWADPRLGRRHHPILPPGASHILPRVALALGALQPPFYAGTGSTCGAMELTAKTSVASDESEDLSSKSRSREDREESSATRQTEDNESNIERVDEDEDFDNENQSQTSVPSGSINDNEELEDDNDAESNSDNSHQSANNNFSAKFIPDPMSCLGLDKEENITPVLNGWVLGAYTAMLGRLSAAAAALEASEVPNMPSESDSESDDSSYTEKSRGSSPTAETLKGYSHNAYDTVASPRAPSRKHLESHPGSSSSESSSSRRCASSGCEYTSNSKCEMESHVAAHVAQGMTPTGKKRSLALQRVRYEREEYRCSLCSYACTIEKAFQRHLRAHARGGAPETRVSCAVCGADRSSEVDLSRHMRRHRDDRYFCCDICVFRTVQLKKLIQHRRMHTGEKPHLCPHCAYRSARRDNLRSHVRRVHKKENLYCDTFSPRGMLIDSLTTVEESSPVAATLVQTPASSPSSTSTGTAN
ncbi:RE1-silencing transcription factor-like isoform X2 [Venturia canescens]|uniref:RE1-silencing transcription factor-like isoform X2 n=1 Tax=Venturia canescens TaxID=32260 RepID=UPI001C9CE795|nr:RE1-silencing transcription factor-like isoform X2 [Venturia canescens]